MRDTDCFVLGGAVAYSREGGSLHFVSTVSRLDKAGGRVEPFRAYTKKNHPVQNVRKMR